MVGLIIRLAHTLGLTVTAESVETEAQCVHLVRLGCDSGQGWFFAPPVAADAVPALAAAQPLPVAERLVVLDARVYTVDAARPTAEAFAVEQGRVVAVCTTAEVRAGREAWPHLGLGGRTVVPGFSASRPRS